MGEMVICEAPDMCCNDRRGVRLASLLSVLEGAAFTSMISCFPIRQRMYLSDHFCATRSTCSFLLKESMQS